jgi:hypothetical protein
MIRTLSFALIIAVVIAACSKDKFQTKPTLKLKSMSGNVVPVGAALQIDFEYTDKEGDVDDTLFVKKIRLNKQKVLTVRDSFGLAVPDFPKNTKGEIQVLMDNAFYLASAANPPKDPVTGKNQPDTLILKFTLKDRANNVSDTVTSSQIIVLR